MEVTSAVEGKDWISNRDLNAGERWFRGILSIADIVPAVASVSKFKTLGNTGWLKQLGTETLNATKQMKHSMQDVVSTASLEGISRLRNAKYYALQRSKQAILKTEESTFKAMKKADELGTKAKNNLNIFASREELSLAGIGNMRNVADNIHRVEKAFDSIYSKIKGNSGENLKALFTKEQLASKPSYSPVPEKWIKKGGTVKLDESGTWVYTNKKGQTVRYPDGYPDFAEYAHPTVKPVEIEFASPTNRPLDYRIANQKAGLSKESKPPVPALDKPPTGYIWHHHQDGNTMILVDKDIHREFTHAGGVSIVNRK